MPQNYKDTNGKIHFLSDADITNGGENLLPAGFTKITVAETVAILNPAPTLAQVQADKFSALNTACAAQIYAGFTSTALGAAYTYPAKDKDQSNLVASVTASLMPNLPAGWTTNFWCADGTGAWAFRPHTAAQIQKVGLDGKTAIETALQKNATLAAQVTAAATVAAVQALVW